MTGIKHIFFDLDHTLWDFNTNVEITLREMFVKYNLGKHISSPEVFIAEYRFQNERYWNLYIDGKITKKHLRTVRYRKTLEVFGIKDKAMAEQMGTDYIVLSPLQSACFPNCHATLDYLKEKYSLHIITNGFEEVQTVKVKSSGIDHYFDNLITSEKAGALKPHRKIFDYTMKLLNATADECIMIGDEPTKDIQGAHNAGIRAIYFNPAGEVLDGVHSISNLNQLMEIL
ncbi:MAG: YjjG family noncanonical pyrimidine nucleotidase [Sphingobacteriales bacterium JAD_PAG50586_3]|nr:MAG: YjjG family noncanonical pyrimidine nucleotidase [Sphingobacteriales bacterium JAD_PAG50586_3]